MVSFQGMSAAINSPILFARPPGQRRGSGSEVVATSQADSMAEEEERASPEMGECPAVVL